jgi:hypothetical protein
MNLKKEYEERAKEIDSTGKEPTGSVGGMTRRVQFARVAFVAFAVAFAICVTIQVFIAGLAVFVNPVHWARHRSFVHFFEFLPLVLLVLSLVGRLPRAMHWQSTGLFGLIFVQYFTANIGTILPWVAATHPVVALLLFWLSIRIVPKAWQLAAR